MESFYRKMRAHFKILMEGDQPVQGKWNYDQLNRKKLPKNLDPPPPRVYQHQVQQVEDEIHQAGLSYIGRMDPHRFIWPVNRQEALDLLEYFLQNLFYHFGDYQDALTLRSWSVFHSRISFALNTKMIDPYEVVQKAEHHWRSHHDNLPIQQVEGFIRQILGWREYMRIIYWNEMPGYAQKNFFEAQRKLPEYYWTGHTHMKCIEHAVSQSLDYAYAHHIQRLMVTGNFAMMAGIDPDEVDRWYLGIYIDAFEWVEITNTRGMSQFADGGIVGTKPYAASASYMHKMGEYCSACHYDRKKKHGEKACPFNSLYWHFIDQCREKMPKNQRMSMMYRLLDKMDRTEKDKVMNQAQWYLENLENL
jgi:deoxyribodipyrimidine photolyase-related protein